MVKNFGHHTGAIFKWRVPGTNPADVGNMAISLNSHSTCPHSILPLLQLKVSLSVLHLFVSKFAAPGERETALSAREAMVLQASLLLEAPESPNQKRRGRLWHFRVILGQYFKGC